MVASEAAAAEDSVLRGGPVGPDKDGSGGARVSVCDPTKEVTAWVLQRKIFTGWSNVEPAPGSKDTATEVRDLEPGTRYCFRMAAVSAEGESEYTKRFCARTPSGGSSSPEPADPGDAVAPTAPADPTGTTPAPPASVVIENLR